MATQTEIHKAHKRGIGGSEVSAILGLDKYSSPYKIWLIKTGREESFKGNKYTVAGNRLEPAVVEYFQEETKYRVIKSSANQKLVIHPKYEFAIGYRDRLYIRNSTIGKGVLECKTTQQMIDDVPETWFAQLQWYLGISDLSYGAVAWLEKGLDFKYKEYEYDPEFFNYMIEHVREFWESYILPDVPPPPMNVDDINRMFTRHIEGSKMDAGPEMISVHNELKTVKEKIKELETRETELSDRVKFAMRDTEVVLEGTKPLFTWRTTAPIHSFNKDAFKVANPDLYEHFTEEKPGIRKFLVK
jgi:putative phage-type endonuclease